MNLDALFYPQSIAVIGASDNLGGGKMPYFQIQQMNGYAGKLYPVNPRRPEVAGIKAYPSINDLPEPVDYALVAAPVVLPAAVISIGGYLLLGGTIISAVSQTAVSSEEYGEKSGKIRGRSLEDPAEEAVK